MKKAAAALLLCAALTGGCTGHNELHSGPAHPEARSYDAAIDAQQAVDEALARAAANSRRLLLVMGANWCHDSRAFAGWMAEPRFKALIAQHYELVFVNVGMPQTGDGHNLHIARRFGLTSLEGTPSVVIATAGGDVLNAATAKSWRNAASRSEEAIYAELLALAKQPMDSSANPMRAEK